MNTNILFPAKFRKIAYVLILSIIAFAIIDIKFLHLSLNNNLESFLSELSTALMCLSLFLIQFTKYPDDDEMLMEIRLKLMLHALMVATLYLIISPIMEYFIFEGERQEIPASQIIMFMLFYQILIFQMKRYSLKKELKKEESNEK